LLPVAIQVARKTVVRYLSDVSLHRFPSSDLPSIIFVPTSHIVTTVPLEPATGIVRVYPAILPPNRQRLAGIHAEEVQSWIVSFWTQLRRSEPASGKLSAAISHVFSAENAKLKHLLWREFRLEFSVKTLANRLCQFIAVVGLHSVIDDYQ